MVHKWRRWILLLLLVITFIANADVFHKIEGDPGEGLPWLTGPLLAPSGEVVPTGHTDIEPYFYLTYRYGAYNSTGGLVGFPALTSANPLIDITQGIAPGFDLEILVPYFFNHRLNASYDGLGDITLLLGYQLMKATKILPFLRVTLGEVFPAGRYKNLSPAKLGTDNLGGGIFQTQLAANFEKVLEFKNNHYLVLRLSLTYGFASSTSVRGFNSYGGGLRTNGRVFVGSTFSADFALEYSLTKHIATALDVLWNNVAPTIFRGFAGPALIGGSVGAPTSQQLSFAPAIEYNFNAHFGIITGAWFTAAGRNAAAFSSWVSAINIYF